MALVQDDAASAAGKTLPVTESELEQVHAVNAAETPAASPQQEEGKPVAADGDSAAVPVADADAADAHREPSSVPNVFGKLEFQPDFEALTKNTTPSNLEWQDVYLNIGGRDILKRISGKVGSHEVMALIGASGAGKSSLMNVLAGRISGSKKKTVSGNMLVNGKPVNPIKYRKNVAYVMQEDALFATATAREALEFSAKLRLPGSVTDEERGKLVDELLKSLGIDHVANTMCGSELVRGLSGGEKKRVSIGVELVTSPSILFLDEPTSGLDSYSSWKVVSILNGLSRSGCAVLCTIHQPSSEIFSIFDKVMVLAKGNVLYNGRVSTIADHLGDAGFPIPPLTNPADFVMVLAQTKSETELPQIDEEAILAARDSKHLTNGPSAAAAGVNGASSTSEAVAKRDGSSIQVPAGATGFDEVRSGGSSMVQFTELTKRETLAIFRDKGALIGRFGITLALNLLFSCIFLDAADIEKDNYTLRSHFGALTNLLIGALFGASQPVLLTLPLEKVTFLREYSTGTYNSTPYFFSKVIIEVVLYLATSVLIVLVQYWLVSFQGPFMALTGEVFVLSLVSASYAFLAGALAPDVKTAQEIAPIIFVPQLLFTGLFVSVDQIPIWLRWIQYLCSLVYALNLSMITEFGGNRCAAENPNSPSNVQACQQLLEQQDVDEDLIGFYIGMLIAIFALFRTLALVVLVIKARNFTS